MNAIHRASLPPLLERLAKVALPAIVVATAGIAFGNPPQGFVSGQTLAATDLNAHFDYVDARVHDLAQ